MTLMVKSWLKIAVLFFLIIFSNISFANAQAASSDEKKIKAALVYNFLKQTKWPEEFLSGNKLKICLLGGDPFSGSIFVLKGRTAQQRDIVIETVQNPGDERSCNIAYINETIEPALMDVLAHLEGKGILTISSIKNFTDQGGMVEFAKDHDQRIRLFINRQKVESEGLKINDRLLGLSEMERVE